ncbi:MAG: hypothetical protein DRQ43_09810 [Gammaproteobacteria bacterium]|nr:MAG: hypothetical protein DRQ43_09810 [Gammaproteobacteria bacterium]
MEKNNNIKTKKRPLLIKLIAPVIVFVMLLAGVVYLGDRLHSLEDNLNYVPPALENMLVDSNSIHITSAQTVYVPIYSHVYSTGGSPQLLEVTLSIRNSDPEKSITLLSAQYYNSHGKKLQNYLKGQLTLGPLQATELLIEKQDARGGSGANFIIEWRSDKPVYEPVIEAIMIGNEKNGISFKSYGRPLMKRIN